jgi:BMFP domain-containing protein YqiC
VQAKYKGDTKKLKKEVSSFRKKVLNKLEDKESIEKAVNEKLQQLMSETGVGCPAVTRRDFIAAARTYNAKTSDYSRQDYSELKWMDVQNCFFAAKSAIEQAEYQFELYSALDELDKSVKKIMSAKKEFAKVKKQAKKKLRSYTNKKGRRKYVQKKVRKVVKKGLRALDKVEKYEVSELENVAAAYEEKAEKCIKKFRITVKKTGRGKTGRSKKVKYGDTYRIKLSPDAGERIISVTVDGRSRKLKNAYTFRKVKKKHSIVVRFSN